MITGRNFVIISVVLQVKQQLSCPCFKMKNYNSPKGWPFCGIPAETFNLSNSYIFTADYLIHFLFLSPTAWLGSWLGLQAGSPPRLSSRAGEPGGLAGVPQPFLLPGGSRGAVPEGQHTRQKTAPDAVPPVQAAISLISLNHFYRSY